MTAARQARLSILSTDTRTPRSAGHTKVHTRTEKFRWSGQWLSTVDRVTARLKAQLICGRLSAKQMHRPLPQQVHSTSPNRPDADGAEALHAGGVRIRL